MKTNTWTKAGRFSAILIAAAAFSACSSDADVKTLKDTLTEPPSENCEFGGKVHVSGKDLNDDGVLQPSEIETREYECADDPNPGESDGTERLNETHAEPAGENCEFGGDRNVTGIDKNKDGVLSFSEIDATTYECNDDPALPEGERLTEVSSIGASPDCVNGGQEIASGLDADESGDLQESEIDSRSYVCAGENPGGTLIDIEILPVGDAACADGGKIIHSGADTDEDGILQEAERENSVTLCAPAEGACDGVAALQVESAQVGPDSYWGHSEGDEYPINVRLSRALDDATLQVIQFDEGFGPDADFNATQSTTEPELVTANWVGVQGDERDATMMVADACGMVFAKVQLPNITGAHMGVRAMLNYQEYEVGDEYHFCWESRNADACELTQHSGGPATPVAAEGCDHFVLDAANFTTNSISGMMIQCSENGVPFASTSLNQQTVPSISGYSLLSNRYFPSGGGDLALRWIGNHVDECEVVTADGRFPVPAVVEDAHLIPVKTSGFISIECKDGDGNVVAERFSSPIIVGAGIELFNASVMENLAAAGWSFAIGTYFLDGTCGLTLTRGDFTKEWTDLELMDAYNKPVYHQVLFQNGSEAGDADKFVEEDITDAVLTCSNADGSNEQVLHYTC